MSLAKNQMEPQTAIHKSHSLVTRLMFGTPGDWASRNQFSILVCMGAVAVLASVVARVM